MWKLFKKLSGKKPPEQPDKTPPEPPEQPDETPPAMPMPPSWTSDMVLEPVGAGEQARYPGYYCATTRIRWVSREKDENGQPLSVREPQPKTFVLPLAAFVAAGRPYASLKQMAVQFDSTNTWCRDKYGRRVLPLAERFPCFDSSDYLYEDRYYRWFFLWENGKLIRVQHTDHIPTVTVTEDVADIENKWWDKIRPLDCFR